MPRKLSIIGWKCRGLEKLSVVPKLKYLLRYYKSDALFLNETVIQSNKTDEFRFLFGFNNCLAVNTNGCSGGLSLFWCHSFNCMVLNYSANYINVEVNDGRRLASWDFFGKFIECYFLTDLFHKEIMLRKITVPTLMTDR